jgi:hypothetical protein
MREEIDFDTATYLSDIRGTADLLKEEAQAITDKLEHNGASGEELADQIDDIADDIYGQMLRLRKLQEDIVEVETHDCPGCGDLVNDADGHEYCDECGEEEKEQ